MENEKLKKQHNETRKLLHSAQGNLAYLMEVFGDTLAEKQGYKDINGMDAIHLYLINKHHWLPRDVRSMSLADLQLALHQEMQGWTLPKELR